jgi:hypothetical protein
MPAPRELSAHGSFSLGAIWQEGMKQTCMSTIAKSSRQPHLAADCPRITTLAIPSEQHPAGNHFARLIQTTTSGKAAISRRTRFHILSPAPRSPEWIPRATAQLQASAGPAVEESILPARAQATPRARRSRSLVSVFPPRWPGSRWDISGRRATSRWQFDSVVTSGGATTVMGGESERWMLLEGRLTITLSNNTAERDTSTGTQSTMRARL